MWRSLRAIVRAGAIMLLAVLALWLGSAAAVLGFARVDNAQRADAIVVLGAAQYAGRPSPALKARLDHAVTLWRNGIARRLIVTGGIGVGDTVSEAAVARKYAAGHGVPTSDILLETHGRTTSESMRAVAGIMERNRMNRAVLVSDRFHMFRLWLLARRYGFIGLTSPTRTSPINPIRGRRWRYVLNESVKAPLALFLP